MLDSKALSLLIIQHGALNAVNTQRLDALLPMVNAIFRLGQHDMQRKAIAIVSKPHFKTVVRNTMRERAEEIRSL
jgi:hypothetical protein